MAPPDENIKPADQCLDMSEVRLQIDVLDRALVRLLSARQRYIERAAEIKRHRSEVRDEARIADVLAKVANAAEQNDLKPEIARAVWRTLMENSIALEMDCYDEIQRRK